MLKVDANHSRSRTCRASNAVSNQEQSPFRIHELCNVASLTALLKTDPSSATSSALLANTDDEQRHVYPSIHRSYQSPSRKLHQQNENDRLTVPLTYVEKVYDTENQSTRLNCVNISKSRYHPHLLHPECYHIALVITLTMQEARDKELPGSTAMLNLMIKVQLKRIRHDPKKLPFNPLSAGMIFGHLSVDQDKLYYKGNNNLKTEIPKLEDLFWDYVRRIGKVEYRLLEITKFPGVHPLVFAAAKMFVQDVQVSANTATLSELAVLYNKLKLTREDATAAPKETVATANDGRKEGDLEDALDTIQKLESANNN